MVSGVDSGVDSPEEPSSETLLGKNDRKSDSIWEHVCIFCTRKKFSKPLISTNSMIRRDDICVFVFIFSVGVDGGFAGSLTSCCMSLAQVRLDLTLKSFFVHRSALLINFT